MIGRELIMKRLRGRDIAEKLSSARDPHRIGDPTVAITTMKRLGDESSDDSNDT